MKRGLGLLAQISLATSASVFALSIYVYEDENWRPVEEPLPGPGFEVAAPFKVTTPGNFRLEAIVPVKIDEKEVGMPEQPPILCNLVLSIAGPDGFHREQAISQLRHGGRYSFGKTDVYVGEPVRISTSGDYTLWLSNRGSLGALSERGAKAAFARFERPTESFLGAVLTRGLGWLTLGVGVLAAVGSWVKK